MKRKSTETGCLLVELPSHQKWDGVRDFLIVAEIEEATGNLFGSAKRVYWIVNREKKAMVHGGHYHPAGGKQEMLFCVTGAARFRLRDANGTVEEVFLENPNQGLVIPSEVWHEVVVGPESVLISIASTNYDPTEAVSEFPTVTD